VKATAAIGLYAVAVVVLSAITAPWIFRGIQFANSQGGCCGWLAQQPFRRVFDRTLLGMALAGLWSLLRVAGIRSWRELGFPRTSRWGRELGWGMVIGMGSLIIAVILQFVLVGQMPNFHPLVSKLLGFALIAGVVAVIEETFFRGALQGVLQRGLPPRVALVLASMVYAALHFLKPSKVVLAADSVRWSSGFEYLSHTVAGGAPTGENIVSFVTLLFVGLILGWAFGRTRALYLPIGLHAGWVFIMKAHASVGGGHLLQHVAVWPALVVVFWGVRWTCRRT